MLMTGIITGESLHGLERIDRAQPQWWIELALGNALAIVAIRHDGRSNSLRVAAVASFLIVTAVVFYVYGIQNPF
jgi:hypothetical protein